MLDKSRHRHDRPPDRVRQPSLQIVGPLVRHFPDLILAELSVALQAGTAAVERKSLRRH